MVKTIPCWKTHLWLFFQPLSKFLLLLTVRSWSWLQLLVLSKIWASKSSSIVKSYLCLKFVNSNFSYLPREWKFDPAWNYKKWGNSVGCGSSHLCLYWCWDILYQIGDLLELWSMVQKIPKCWWVLKIQCTKGKVCMSIEIIKMIF
jgi:hypothetical protein